MMGIVVPETCWAYKKYNKNIKWHLVGFLFFSSYSLCGEFLPLRNNVIWVSGDWIDVYYTLST